MKRTVNFAAFVFVSIYAAAAHAHALNLFVHDEGGAVKGSAYFTGGIPAKNIHVQVLDSTGKEVAAIETDAEGNFTYPASRTSGTLTFVASTPDGHRAESKLEAPGSSGTPQMNSSTPAASAGATDATSRQIGALQEAIDRLEKRLWLRDVIGGVGYIFGLAGLWALWKSRSRRPGH